MNTVRLICTDVGNFPPTPELIEILDSAKFRKDGQPDRRTKAGKRWDAAFREFSQQKIAEYLAS